MLTSSSKLNVRTGLPSEKRCSIPTNSCKSLPSSYWVLHCCSMSFKRKHTCSFSHGAGMAAGTLVAAVSSYEKEGVGKVVSQEQQIKISQTLECLKKPRSHQSHLPSQRRMRPSGPFQTAVTGIANISPLCQLCSLSFLWEILV